MVSVKSAVMIGGIVALMLMLQVSCNDNVTVSSNNNKKESSVCLEYYTSKEVGNWIQSNGTCRTFGLQLVILRSDAEKSALIKHIESEGWRNVDFWIHTCNNVSGLVCQRDCTEVSVNNQSLIEIHPQSAAPCSKQNRHICQKPQSCPLITNRTQLIFTGP